MDNKDSKPSTTKSDLIIITPDELLKLGIFKDVQRTAAKLPSNVEDSSVSFKQKIRNRTEQVVKSTNQNETVSGASMEQKSRHTEVDTEILSSENTLNKKHSCSSLSTPNIIDKNIAYEPERKLTKKGRCNNASIAVFKNKIKSQIGEKEKSELPVIIKCDKTMESKIDVLTGPNNRLEPSISNIKKYEELNLPKPKQNSLKDIVGKQDGNKKELNIISDTPVYLSSDELKHLVSNAKLKKNCSAKEEHSLDEHLQDINEIRNNEEKPNVDSVVSKSITSTSNNKKCRKKIMPKKRINPKNISCVKGTSSSQKEKPVFKKLNTMKKIIFDALKKKAGKACDKMSIILSQSTSEKLAQDVEEHLDSTESSSVNNSINDKGTELHELRSPAEKNEFSKRHGEHCKDNIETELRRKYDEEVIEEELNTEDIERNNKREKHTGTEKDRDSIIGQDVISNFSVDNNEESFTLTVPKKRGRKRRLLIFDSIPTPKSNTSERMCNIRKDEQQNMRHDDKSGGTKLSDSKSSSSNSQESQNKLTGSPDAEVAGTSTMEPEKQRRLGKKEVEEKNKTIVLIDECNKTVPPTKVVSEEMPKKRGRPKKKPNVEETKLDIVSTILTITEISDTATEIKSEHTIIDGLKKIEESNYETEDKLLNLAEENKDSSSTARSADTTKSPECHKEETLKLKIDEDNTECFKEHAAIKKQKGGMETEDSIAEQKCVSFEEKEINLDKTDCNKGSLTVEEEETLAAAKKIRPLRKNKTVDGPRHVKSSNKRGKDADVEVTQPRDKTTAIQNKTTTNSGNKGEAGQSKQEMMHEKIVQKSKYKHLSSIESTVPKVLNRRVRRKKNADIEDTKPEEESIKSNRATTNTDKVEADESEQTMINEEIVQEADAQNKNGFSIKYRNLSPSEPSVSTAPNKGGKRRKNVDIEEIKSKDEFVTSNTATANTDKKIKPDESEQKIVHEGIVQKGGDDSNEDAFSRKYRNWSPSESSVIPTPNKRRKERRNADIAIKPKDESIIYNRTAVNTDNEAEDDQSEQKMNEEIMQNEDNAPNEDDLPIKYRNVSQTESSISIISNKRGKGRKKVYFEDTKPEDESITSDRAVAVTDNKPEDDQSEQKMNEDVVQKEDNTPNENSLSTKYRNVSPTESSISKAPNKRGRRKINADTEKIKPKDESVTYNKSVAVTDNKAEDDQSEQKMNEDVVQKEDNTPNENSLSTKYRNVSPTESSISKAPNKRGRRKKTVDSGEIKPKDESITYNKSVADTGNKTEDDKAEQITNEEIAQKEDNARSSVLRAPNKRGRKKKNVDIEEIRDTDEFPIPNRAVAPADEVGADQSKKVMEEEIVPKYDDAQNEDSSDKIIIKSSKDLNRATLESSLMKSTPDAAMESESNQIVKRKRGRPRKIKIVEEAKVVEPTLLLDAIENENIAAETLSLDTSVNGRKRKKVNYFEIENDTYIGDDGGRKRRRKAFTSTLKISKKDKSETDFRDSENAPDLDILGKDTPSTSGSVEDNQKGVIEYENGDVKQNLSNEKKELMKKNKYKKTGETTLMINSIFTAAFKQRPSGIETEDDAIGVPEEIPANALIDSRTRLAKIANIVVDEDDMVVCVECNRKVNNDEWLKHNRYAHYNLSWREGEMEVNMNNSEMLLKILRPILKEDHYLVCRKCKKKSSSVGGYVTHREICTGIVSSTGQVTCAICEAVMEKNKWSLHKQNKHNNLAWRVGDRPLNLKDKNLVMSILNGLYKARKPLHCDKCGALKKSVIGFLSHQTQCGTENEDAKVKCELCDKKVLPVSMPSHMKMVHETSKQKDFLSMTSDYFDISMESLPKRKAAKTAMLIIDKISQNKIVQERTKHYIAQVDFEETFVMFFLQKELAQSQTIKCKFKDCEFKTDSVRILVCHMNMCAKKPEQHYICKKCLLICETEVEIKAHIKTAHDIDIIDDDFDSDQMEVESDGNFDDSDDESLQGRKLGDKKVPETTGKVKPNFLWPLAKRPRYLFCRAFKYTIEFCEANHSILLLFDELRNRESDWTLLDDELTETYLPQTEESCSVAKRTVCGFNSVVDREYTFKKFELFESDCEEGIATIFCGGPIYSLAWLPTPYTTSDSKQVLAVAAGKDFDGKYWVGKIYKDPSVIQFWDFGVLRNKEKMSTPRLMFCLAFDFGPVWHLEWCPSGCYNSQGAEKEEKSMPRMGLLAVAGSDSFVYIYSIPFLDEEQMGLIYKMKPVLKLQLTIKNEVVVKRDRFFATKISWSAARGHRYIAVGYSDGMVGLFDLETDSKLLRIKDQDIDVLLPYRKFSAHVHYISALSWVPISGGNRWLMTASFDRDVLIWDLTNGSKLSCSQKQMITDGQWLSNWVAFVTSADESSTNFHAVRMCLQSYRDYLYEHVYLMVSPSTVTSLSTSNWLNSIIQCSAQGEITVAFSNQLMYSLNTEKNLKRLNHYLGYIKLIDKIKTPEERVAEEKLMKEADQKTINNPVTKYLPTTRLLNMENSHYSKYEPITYKDATEKYGLLFCDMKMTKFTDLQNTKFQDLSFSRPNLYSMQKINKIAYNPNRQASLYYATGHEVGFVRVTYLQFLENDPQVV